MSVTTQLVHVAGLGPFIVSTTEPVITTGAEVLCVNGEDDFSNGKKIVPGVNLKSNIVSDDYNLGLADILNVSAAYTTDPTDFVILCETGTGTYTITLPAAVTKKIYIIKRIGTNTITVTPDGSETIDGATSFTLSTQYQTLRIIGHSGAWYII